MSKPQTESGNKNVIGPRLKLLREKAGFSQRQLAHQLQLVGCDVDKNVITRIEQNNRYVCDFEIKAISKVFNVSYEYLLDGEKSEDF